MKVCRVCGIKLIIGINCLKGRYINHAYICNNCNSNYNKEYTKNNKEKIKKYRKDNHKKLLKQMRDYGKSHVKQIQKQHRIYFENNRNKIRKREREYRIRNKEKIIKQKRAQRMLEYHVKIGSIIKQPCEICGSIIDVEGHHDDYDKPLEVRWLCRKHHMRLHADMKREGITPDC